MRKSHVPLNEDIGHEDHIKSQELVKKYKERVVCYKDDGK
jgi:hypothetical protein